MSDETPLEIAHAWAAVVEQAILDNARPIHIRGALADLEREKATVFAAVGKSFNLKGGSWLVSNHERNYFELPSWYGARPHVHDG